MWISDELYGEFQLEDVLAELVTCEAVQRLKKIHQGGGAFLVNEQWSGTRYEHSVGVMLLIRMLGGSVEEQLLGLLHDISHTAFSHVVDYVLEDESEEFHETIYEEIIFQSEIPMILNKYGYDFNELMKLETPRLEAALPDLCADRVDYTLRDLYHWGVITKDEIQCFLNQLSFVDNKLVLSSIEIGEWFTRTYRCEVVDYFMHPLNVYANDQLAKLLKEALEKGIIDMTDFKQDDEYLLGKLIACGYFNIETFKDAFDESNLTSNRLFKLRMVDPLVVDSLGQVFRLSEISDEMKGLIDESLNKMKNGI